LPRSARRSPLAAAHGEHLAEQIAEDVADVHAARKRTRAKALRAQASMAKAIVSCALIGIAQYLVGLAGLFELLFGCSIARIPVRMVLHRLFSVRALQLLIAGLAGDAENFVIICFAHSCI